MGQNKHTTPVIKLHVKHTIKQQEPKHCASGNMKHIWLFFYQKLSDDGIKWATQVHFKLHLLGREPCCHPGLQSASVWCWWGYRGWATEGLAGQFLPHWTAARQSCKAPPEPLVTTVSKPAAGTAQALCGEAKWESNRRKDESNMLRDF